VYFTQMPEMLSRSLTQEGTLPVRLASRETDGRAPASSEPIHRNHGGPTLDERLRDLFSRSQTAREDELRFL
jgi:hypothetical protein